MAEGLRKACTVLQIGAAIGWISRGLATMMRLHHPTSHALMAVACSSKFTVLLRSLSYPPFLLCHLHTAPAAIAPSNLISARSAGKGPRPEYLEGDVASRVILKIPGLTF